MYKITRTGKNYLVGVAAHGDPKKTFCILEEEKPMNSNQMKNIIVLKNLPSNLIDEAFIILKNNKKIESLERIEKQGASKIEKEKGEEYIVKEAEMVISSYLSNIEHEKQIKSHSMRQLENKCKRLKGITIILALMLALNAILNLIRV